MESKIKVHEKEFEIFIDEATIAKRIATLAAAINEAYATKTPLFLGVLNGSFLFFADLIKGINIPCETEFIKVASYHGTNSTGKIKDALGMPTNLNGRDIIIVEDIVDTGFTMRYVIEQVQKLSPASITVCSLLLKPEALQIELPELKYVGFDIPNEFVVGYGLDYDGLGRNINQIYKAV